MAKSFSDPANSLEFSKRHMLVPYKVHQLISARLKIENVSSRALLSMGGMPGSPDQNY
jgi:hypothetical protein